MRALVIDIATVNLYRKLRKAAGEGRYAFAVLSDCAVFASAGPIAQGNCCIPGCGATLRKRRSGPPSDRVVDVGLSKHEDHDLRRSYY
ncbi:hypothetical protein ACIRBX_33585 [Kitasatospora sp. NPDC096147]|uniref:hypothetical protein n=1 Tax=Kitasatospora sp. NPDC096147 TaxID=3364093 RepID=UPI00381AC157